MASCSCGRLCPVAAFDTALLFALAAAGAAAAAGSVTASARSPTRRKSHDLRTLLFFVPLLIRSHEATIRELITAATIAYRPDTGLSPH
ncbi:hypothetical protein Raf01_75140 [Rugosimonospora africana]|uniref:Secreted protein n=1 Tax=Rugosimonospora africana TaxID=556532 RepID=A0A8J3R031_9ACTN|nr:hypothetical protein Raf01_75140 [Rugosimonospora africana]